jgi:hypothetical protein
MKIVIGDSAVVIIEYVKMILQNAMANARMILVVEVLLLIIAVLIFKWFQICLETFNIRVFVLILELEMFILKWTILAHYSYQNKIIRFTYTVDLDLNLS